MKLVIAVFPSKNFSHISKRVLFVFLVFTFIFGSTTGCGNGTTVGQSAPTPAPTPAPSLTITSVSTNVPTPLTPLIISTTGLDINSPVFVQLSNAAGFLASENPIRIAANGAVIAPVPIYIDPPTNQITQGVVSLTLVQGNHSSSPVQLTIQELPTVASYGTQLGEISHAFINFEAITLGRQINELQAFQLLPGNKVDTAASMTSLNNLMLSTIKSRNDVDRILADNTVTISAGILPDGTPIQFDQSSVDLMDRVLGAYLTQLVPVIMPASGLPVGIQTGQSDETVVRMAQTGSFNSRPVFGRATRGGHLRRLTVKGHADRARKASPAASSTMKSVLAFLEGANNGAGIAKAIQDAGKKDATFFDKALAVAGGATNLLILADNGGISKIAKNVAPALGAFTASYGLLKNLGNELGDLAFIMVASRNGTDPTVLQEAQDDLNKNAHEAIFNTIEAELSLTDAGAVFGAFGKDVIKTIENGGAGVSLQSAEFLTTLFHAASDGEDNTVATTDLAAAGEIQSPFSSSTMGFAEITGAADITNDQGPIFAGLTGIQLAPLDAGDTFALADPAGNYDMFITLQVTNTDYTNLTLSAIDPISGIALGSEVVNLSGLTTSSNGVEPTVNGVCSDTDASTPDADDPDCD
jgi:hypothetical protein